jgi:ketosteroid isomerase-like protein
MPGGQAVAVGAKTRGACGGLDRPVARTEDQLSDWTEAGRMDIRAMLTELCEAFNAHDLDRIMAFFSDDCVLEMPRGSKPWGSRFEGKRNVREALATRFEGLPDVHYGNDEHFVDSTADTGISKWTLTGTTREGTRIEVQGCDFYTFRDGKVIRKDSYWKIVE